MNAGSEEFDDACVKAFQTFATRHDREVNRLAHELVAVIDRMDDEEVMMPYTLALDLAKVADKLRVCLGYPSKINKGENR